MSYRESEGFVSRRNFLATGGTIAAAAALARPGSAFAAAPSARVPRRLALVGTGSRGNSMS